MVGSTPPLFQVFKKTGGLVWKRMAMNHTRRANAKERHRRMQQVRASPLHLVTGSPLQQVREACTVSSHLLQR